MSLINYAGDSTAARWAAKWEAEGHAPVFRGSDGFWSPADDAGEAEGAFELADDEEFAAAAVIVDQIEKDGYTPSLTALAEALYEQQAQADDEPVQTADTTGRADELDRAGEKLAEELAAGGRAYDDEALELAERLSYTTRRET